jgi:peptide/nickel transport system permease protein
MIKFILRRLGYALFTIFMITIVAFAVIQLPPGDYITDKLNQVRGNNGQIDPATEERLREAYGFNEPGYVQYFKWITNIITRGEFGWSFVRNRDAGEIIKERLPMSMAMTLGAFALVWAIALPLGIYSAVKKYSIIDYGAGFLGFVGIAIPNFILAIVLLFLTYKWFDRASIGLFSTEFQDAPWSFARVIDMLKHLWVPALVVSMGGIASLVQTMRANLLDELNKPYVNTARAKGLSETRLLWKYPVRHALNPFVSTIGWLLPALISGEVIVSIVMNLPTAGGLLFRALLDQDQYVAAGFILVLSGLTVVGTFISDLLLAWLDPRIRLS